MSAADAPGTLVLILTRRCALRCGFCPQGFEERDMSPAVLRAALGGLGPRLSGPRRVKLFGGEPLLVPSLVRQAVRLAGGLQEAVSVELATEGGLLDEPLAAFLAAHPRVQVVFSRPSAWARRLPNVSLNLVIRPGETPQRVLARLRSALDAGLRRVNVLPAFFVPWSPGEVAGLRRALAALRVALARLRGRGLAVELANRSRLGRLPLFNDGWCVDTDGRVYASNLVLARGIGAAAERLRLGHVGAPSRLKAPPADAELRAALAACFPPRALEGTRRADRALGEFVHAAA